MTTIAETVRELRSLNSQIKSKQEEMGLLRQDLNALKLKKKDREDEIITYLNEKDQPGIKCDNFVVLTESKQVRMRKKKADKLRDGQEVLDRYGIEESDKVLKEVMEAMRGEKNTVSGLRTRNI